MFPRSIVFCLVPPVVKTAVLLCCLLGSSIPGSIAAQQITMDTLSLQRLPGVFVVVPPVTERAGLDGFSVDSVQRLIVAKLEDARIRVLSQPEWQTTLGSPMLYLALDLAQVSRFQYLYHLEIELRQLAVTMRDSSPAFVPTWRSGSHLGAVRASQLRTLMGMVLEATDRFISAHAAANRPRRLQLW